MEVRGGGGAGWEVCVGGPSEPSTATFPQRLGAPTQVLSRCGGFGDPPSLQETEGPRGGTPDPSALTPQPSCSPGASATCAARPRRPSCPSPTSGPGPSTRPTFALRFPAPVLGEAPPRTRSVLPEAADPACTRRDPSLHGSLGDPVARASRMPRLGSGSPEQVGSVRPATHIVRGPSFWSNAGNTV